MALIILLASLALAAGAGYLFLQWKCPTKQEKLTQLAEEIKSIVPEEANNQAGDLDPEQLIEASPSEIRQAKRKLTKVQKELKEEITKTQKAIKEEADEDEKTKKQEGLEQLHELDPKLTEVVSIIQPVQKKEDFQQKVYGLWDYVYAGGIALIIFGLTWSIGGLFIKRVKGEGD